MGVNCLVAKWLFLIKHKYGVDYTNNAVLGRQALSLGKKSKAIKELGALFDLESIIQEDGYSENFWKVLGGENSHLDVFDYSDYEGANCIHDLNEPIPIEYYDMYSSVIDGGTMEHVFNYPQALINVMRMVRMGGHLILITPCNQWLGHGFYQFSPELFYSVLREQNGFSIEELLIYEEEKPYSKSLTIQYDNVKSSTRFQYKTDSRALILLVAKRCGNIPDKLVVQQSDYVFAWDKDNISEGSKANDNHADSRRFPKVGDFLKRYEVLERPYLRVTSHINEYMHLKSLRHRYDIEKELNKVII